MPVVLVASPPTMDYMVYEDSVVPRPGGPALYSSFGASMVGWRVYAVGPWGWETMATTRVEWELGVERLGYQAAGRGAVFRHVYMGNRRFSEILGRPEGFRVDELLRAIDEVKPDAILLSPITGEESGYVAELLAHRTDVKCVGLDVQGYVRGFGGVWEAFIPEGRSYLVHISSDDTGEEGVWRAVGLMGSRGVLVYTRGPGPVSLIIGGSELRLPGPARQVKDPTGAGDIFTTITLASYCESGDIVYAVKRALELTPEALEEARRSLG